MVTVTDYKLRESLEGKTFLPSSCKVGWNWSDQPMGVAT